VLINRFSPAAVVGFASINVQNRSAVGSGLKLQSIHFSEKAAELSMGRNDKVRAKTATVENRGPIELEF
jgi:hypothetical protein